jgi:hypothetical protein
MKYDDSHGEPHYHRVAHLIGIKLRQNETNYLEKQNLVLAEKANQNLFE